MFSDSLLWNKTVILAEFAYQLLLLASKSVYFVLCLYIWCRSESLTAESRSIHANSNYRLMKSRSESDLSQPESDEEGYSLVSKLVLCALDIISLFSM